jgi:hypothetical protein
VKAVVLALGLVLVAATELLLLSATEIEQDDYDDYECLWLVTSYEGGTYSVGYHVPETCMGDVAYGGDGTSKLDYRPRWVDDRSVEEINDEKRALRGDDYYLSDCVILPQADPSAAPLRSCRVNWKAEQAARNPFPAPNDPEFDEKDMQHEAQPRSTHIEDRRDEQKAFYEGWGRALEAMKNLDEKDM